MSIHRRTKRAGEEEKIERARKQMLPKFNRICAQTADVLVRNRLLNELLSTQSKSTKRNI